MPIIFNLLEPKYSEDYKCFYCGSIVPDNEKCKNGCEGEDDK